ncbi:1-acyl-sn-glycerol-3-phosphate acyltransferase [Paracoccaceae bacterium]|nr:1-acyl-sn-glycerol-3-phosphate acyltransferase [Paracoccaceae bacterium]
MSSIAVLRVLIVLALTITLMPMYLLGLALDYLFGKRIVVLLIKKFWSRAVMKTIGLEWELVGLKSEAHVFVSNHISWIDILAINSTLDVVFIAKKEVRSWPGLGVLAALAQTIFIERKSLNALSHKRALEECLKKGQSIFFFPEGTSTDGSTLKQFKSSLFEVCYGDTFKEKILGSVQPLTIIYKSPIQNDPGFYSFWREEDTIFKNIKKVIRKVRHGRVRLIFHKPIEINTCGDRKHLSYACYEAVKNGLVSPENSF